MRQDPADAQGRVVRSTWPRCPWTRSRRHSDITGSRDSGAWSPSGRPAITSSCGSACSTPWRPGPTIPGPCGPRCPRRGPQRISWTPCSPVTGRTRSRYPARSGSWHWQAVRGPLSARRALPPAPRPGGLPGCHGRTHPRRPRRPKNMAGDPQDLLPCRGQCPHDGRTRRRAAGHRHRAQGPRLRLVHGGTSLGRHQGAARWVGARHHSDSMGMSSPARGVDEAQHADKDGPAGIIGHGRGHVEEPPAPCPGGVWRTVEVEDVASAPHVSD